MLSLFVYLVILLIPLGQFSRLPLPLPGDVSVYLNDILIPLFLLLFFIHSLGIKKRLEIPPFFGLWMFWLSLGILGSLSSLSTGFLNSTSLLTGSLYLARFLEYLLWYLAIFNLVKTGGKKFIKTNINLMVCSGLIFAVLGLLQYRLFPDFSALVEHGWDPHYYRVLSTFFDPNFAGLFLTLVFLLITSIALVKPIGILAKLVMLTLVGLAIVLTFSRSTYLALILGLGILGWLRAKKIILIGLLAGFLIFLFIPRVQERVIGALNVDETAKLRLENYSKTLIIIKNHWLTGVGFNNFRFSQSYYGLFQDKRGVEQASGHSGSGSDSSLLLVFATTGILGISVFIGLIGLTGYRSLKIYQKSFGQQKYLALALVSSLFAIMIHSQFVNSFFYPWIMLWFFLLLGLTYGSNSD